MRYARWIAVGVLLFTLASCVTSATSTGVMPATATMTASHTATVPPDVETKVEQIEVYCPTDNEEAREAYNSGTRLHFEEGKVDEARELYLRAIELDSGFCDAMDNLGQLYRQEGDLESAIKWYKRSIKVLYENPAVHMNLGLTYLLQGKPDEAAAEYKVLIELDPKNPEGYYGLGDVYLVQGQFREALEQLEAAEELYLKMASPYLVDARYKLGIASYALEEYASAKIYFEQVYPEFTDDPDLNFYLGMCYLTPQLNDLELARKYLLKAQALGVDLPSDVLDIIKP